MVFGKQMLIENLNLLKRPVVVTLMGGLGNQLFQYAAARALADQINTNLFIDLSHYTSEQERNYELGAYHLRAEVLGTDFTSRLRKKVILKRLPGFQEASFAYDSRVRDLGSGVWLKGYFQSEKYFILEEQRIKKDLTLKIQLSEQTQKLQKVLMADKNAVSLHVRRGDYVSNPSFNAFHGVTSIEYYERALNLVAQTHPNLSIYIFSDDPVWVTQNMKFKYPQTVVQANSADRGFEDLHLMALCQHHILANSSFSWWGAWLARHSGQIVVAPKKWFQASNMDDRDLLPSNWIRI
jgi:hypothetical protein